MGDMSIVGETQLTSPVIVAARVRPLLPSERINGLVCAQALPQAQQIVLGNECFKFPVDYAFPIGATQSQVFEAAVQPLMDRLLQGYDTSVVTYGQPTSGKTYTMLGPGVAFHISETEYGIIPRATRYIFSRMKQGPPKKFQVKVSFVNVQNEMLRDLLTSSPYQKELVLLESDAGYPVITGLQEVECETIEMLCNYLQLGMENRQLEWNNAKHSGRPAQAHSIFTLSLEQQWVTPEGTIEQRLSIARFTDLASSEKIYFRGMGGHIMGETIHVDPGLIALGRVIQTICQPNDWMCYNTSKDLYQQSTLTKILKESFGGRSYSLVVCCLSPALPHFDESLGTLQTSEKLRLIRNTPVMNALSVRVQSDSNPHDLINQTGSVNLACGETGITDTFGLEFATTQWIKLVDSAEGLFNKLVRSNTLSKHDKDEIEKWLCLKHECEECVGSDDAASLPGNDGRILEKIDEVTETEERTDSSKEIKYSVDNQTEELKSDSETESEVGSGSQRPDFIDKLDKYIEQFKKKTDEDVNNKQDEYREENVLQRNGKFDDDTSESVLQHPIRSCFPNNGRRRSIHPGTQLPLMALGYTSSPNVATVNIGVDSEDMEGEKSEANNVSLECILSKQATGHENQDNVRQELEPQQQLKLLILASETKQNQMKQATVDIEGLQKRLGELQATILVLEQFIEEINNYADTRATAKQRFLEKKTKLEGKYHKTCSQIAELQNALCKPTLSKEENSKLKREVDQFEKKARNIQQCLKSVDIIRQITGDIPKSILDLEQKLKSSHRLMDKLEQRLRREESRKVHLEQELAEGQIKIREMQDKCNLEEVKTDNNCQTESVGCNSREGVIWIKEEEQRQVNMRESSQRLQDPFFQRDTLSKEKISLEKQRTRNILEVNARISHLDQVLKDKSTDLEKIKDEDEKQALRLEIHNLRTTRDCLIEQRCALDDKFQKEKALTTVEERKLLECDEAIEAIDAAIEYKNELICGRKGGFEAEGREKGEELLMARLNKLSEMEMRMLLYKYFQKVIDLRESGRKLEVQLTEKEIQNDQQTWQIQTLTHAIQQYRLEAERQIILIQRQHQDKIHLMLRTFTEESSGGGGGSSGTDTWGNQHNRVEKEEQLSLKAENRRLHRRLQDLEATLQKLQSSRKTNNNVEPVGNSRRDPRCRSPSPEPVCPEPIPNKSMKQLRAAATALTTKVTQVTRQKNKLIIQQQKPSGHSKQVDNN